MTIKEFVEIATKGTNKKMNVILETKKYVPISEKRELVQSVLDVCVNNNNGVVEYDSLDKYLIFTISIISKYTNLEFGADGDSLADYDLLCEHGLLDEVIKTFDVEYERTNGILNMMLSDIIRANSMEASFASLSNGIANGIDRITYSLKDKIDNFDMNINNIDPALIAQLSGLLNNN